MFINKRMTADPVTISSKTTVAEASELMRSRKFRRLPVVDNGKLVGIVTDRDLRQVTASPATSLSIFELTYLLAKMQVKEVMTKQVFTIDSSATVEEAALLMYNQKIGGLVVVDESGAVAGVITETDIFKSFVDIMGLPEGKTRMTFVVENRVGALADISAVFKELGINIGSMVTYPYEEDPKKSEVVIRAGITDIEKTTKSLERAGFPIQHIAQIG